MNIKWHDHPLLFRSLEHKFENRLRLNWIKSGTSSKNPSEIARSIISILNNDDGNQAAQNSYIQMQHEARWIEDRRPYYNIWPSVIRPFTNVDLSKVMCSDVHLPLPQLLIRLPVGHELEGARSIFVTEGANGDDRGILVAINNGATSPIDSLVPVHTVNGVIVKQNETIMDRLEYGRKNPYSNDEINDSMVDACFKLVIAICLLADNPDLIERSPLESDRTKWEATHDIKLIEKAERRGKREWDVGSHIEVAPGFRNAHFAIRWMGRGVEVRKKPVLRPVKSCLVRRREIQDVPTVVGVSAPQHCDDEGNNDNGV